MTVTSSTKLIYFQRKYQESAQIAEYAVHLLTRLGRLEIHIAVRQIRSDATILVQGYCVVILLYPYFELNIEQDAVRPPLLIKKGLDKLNDFIPFYYFLVF